MLQRVVAGSGRDDHVRRGEILKAARAVIEEHGPNALTGQIADRAGLARPNFYRHFSSKDELDLAIVRSGYADLRSEVRKRIAKSDTPIDLVRALIAAQAIWARRHPNTYRFLVSHGLFQRLASAGGKRNSGRRRERHDFAAELLAAATRYVPRLADDPDAAEATIIELAAFTQASILLWLGRRTESADKLTDRLTTQNWLIIDDHLRKIGTHLDPAMHVSRPEQVGS